MGKLDRYIGKVVRLNKQAFARLLEQTSSLQLMAGNRFLVSGINKRLNKLICYGSSIQVLVDPGDVVLV